MSTPWPAPRHVANELCALRRDNLRPVLRQEYASLCNNNLPLAEFLFGDDLPKRVRDAKDTASLSNSIINQRQGFSGAKNYPRSQGQKKHFKAAGSSQSTSGKGIFLGKRQDNNHSK